ncbi:Surfactin synthase thioesterase subunit [Amycolatopsis lurida]|uniref:Thioesterase n=1 Tax=Amycolatopsis lurida NRRL 2430 TaxID=1460371 RepID=A0A2P2FZD5_AMYLU|nr:thioesterase [Amycolatopsis lurida NRRL 2430]SEC44429.1 Surfactin synthase thioesterase subunit [Amycolatopsis lurida]
MGVRQLSLVCLPFAGSGAGFFREWKKSEVAGVRVCPIQLPGREERFLEDPFKDVADAVAELTPQIVAEVGVRNPVALFGHSLGAVLAYEIARELGRIAHPGLCHLYVSGSPGPWSPRVERATGLPDEEFVAKVQRFAGYRHAAFDNPGLLEVLLPVLRADVAMHENYRPTAGAPLTVPITALRGTRDRLVSRAQAEQWATMTEARFEYRELEGVHMYLTEAPERVLRIVAGDRACR